MNENTYKLAAIALLCTTIAAGALALNYQYKYTQLENDYQQLTGGLENFTIQVDLMIDYGDGTVEWYNETRIQTGANLWDLTLENCDVEYEMYDFGAFITSINGVEADDSHYWGWSYLEENSWSMGMVGAEQYNLHDGYVVSWIYTGF